MLLVGISNLVRQSLPGATPCIQMHIPLFLSDFGLFIEITLGKQIVSAKLGFLEK
jgi:hypothetical protein